MLTTPRPPLRTLLAVIAAVVLLASACSSTTTVDNADATDSAGDAAEASADADAAEVDEATGEATDDVAAADDSDTTTTDTSAADATETSDADAEADPDTDATETEANDTAAEAETTEPAADAGDSTQSAVVATDWLGSYELADAEYGTMVTVTVDGATRTIVSNSLPNHETGDFPNAGNPNEITAQDLNYEFTTEPVYTGNATFAQTSGVGVNGIAMEPGTGETVTCESGESYRIEALQDLYNLGLDVNNAHVQPGGQYHYHGLSQFLVNAFDTDDDLVHVGFAADGFLMYYSKSGAYSTGYALSTETRTGTNCTYRGAAVDIDGTAPDGTYVSDWVHSESGDLDSCMGTQINGEYAYVIGEQYPFISRCLNGEVTGGRAGGPPPSGAEGAEGGDAEGAAGGQGGAPQPPDLDAAAAELGITADELRAALGGPPPDLDASAERLGITVEELAAALGVPAN